MFICTTCINKLYENSGSFLSMGRCEVCHQHELCCDIPSKALILKDKAIFYVETPMGAQVEVAKRLNGRYEVTNQLMVMLNDNTPIVTNGDNLGIQTVGGIREAAIRQVVSDIKKEMGSGS